MYGPVFFGHNILYAHNTVTHRFLRVSGSWPSSREGLIRGERRHKLEVQCRTLRNV